MRQGRTSSSNSVSFIISQSDKETVITGIRLKLIDTVLGSRQHNHSVGRTYLIKTNNSGLMLLFSHANEHTSNELTVHQLNAHTETKEWLIPQNADVRFDHKRWRRDCSHTEIVSF